MSRVLSVFLRISIGVVTIAGSVAAPSAKNPKVFGEVRTREGEPWVGVDVVPGRLFVLDQTHSMGIVSKRVVGLGETLPRPKASALSIGLIAIRDADRAPGATFLRDKFEWDGKALDGATVRVQLW